jgi:hypothetical protein
LSAHRTEERVICFIPTSRPYRAWHCLSPSAVSYQSGSYTPLVSLPAAADVTGDDVDVAVEVQGTPV